MATVLDMFNYFFKRDSKKYDDSILDGKESISGPNLEDGATEFEVNASGSYDGMILHSLGNLESNANNTIQLINTYRSLVNHYEVDNTIQEIVNDAIVFEKGHNVVELDLEHTEFSDNIKTKIQEELQEILNKMNFNRRGLDFFRRWYIDSRIYFHKVVNPNHIEDGIQELRILDPRYVEFVREIITDMENGEKIIKGYKEYFLYTPQSSYQYNSINYSQGNKIKIPASAITYAHSGLTDCDNKNIIGYLHRAIKPANQLKMLEDAVVIYRITRAPDRRIFYVDTGNMPSRKATQYMQSIMNSINNRVIYDSNTGKIKSQKANMSLTEDYWLQRRDGKSVTEVDTLPGMSGMNELDDVRYFRKAMYMSLRVPLSRIPDDQTGQTPLFDNGSAITRDEVKFGKFITELQNKFEPIFLDPLKSNLVMKKIITEDEWDNELNNIKIVYHRDSYFAETKDMEIEERRFNLLSQAEPYIGKYMSHQTAMKKILQLSDEDIREESKQIDAESKIERYKNEEDL